MTVPRTITSPPGDVTPSTGRYELHCHLDGSLRQRTIAELAAESGLVLTAPVRDLAVAPPDVGSLQAFLPYIDVALAVLQTGPALRRAARELVEDWAADGVIYGEARFAPQLHNRAELGIGDAIKAVASGLADGRRSTGVGSGLIVCCLRHQDPGLSLEVAAAASSHRDLVAGLDLAGDEALAGLPHRQAFDLAREAGLHITVHAGEAAGPRSVWEAIDVLGAERIGHGVRSVADPALVHRLATDRITLETCPRCNVLTRAVPSMSHHPIRQLLDSGVPVTVSTDTRTTADTTLDLEFEALSATFGWGPNEHDAVQHLAREAAFADPPREPGHAE